ncbi:hypothetical protein ABPG72_008438 [Tetrahymena utriculariae]
MKNSHLNTFKETSQRKRSSSGERNLMRYSAGGKSQIRVDLFFSMSLYDLGGRVSKTSSFTPQMIKLESIASVKMPLCTRGELHKLSQLELVCLEQGCSDQYKLICAYCRDTMHKNHDVRSIKYMLNELIKYLYDEETKNAMNDDIHKQFKHMIDQIKEIKEQLLILEQKIKDSEIKFQRDYIDPINRERSIVESLIKQISKGSNNQTSVNECLHNLFKYVKPTKDSFMIEKESQNFNIQSIEKQTMLFQGRLMKEIEQLNQTIKKTSQATNYNIMTFYSEEHEYLLEDKADTIILSRESDILHLEPITTKVLIKDYVSDVFVFELQKYKQLVSFSIADVQKQFQNSDTIHRISQIIDRLPQSIEKLSISLAWDKDLLDEDILVLFQNVNHLKFPYLKILDLDFGNSSLAISVLTDKSMIFLANSISSFQDSLWVLNLNLYCWGLSNIALTDKGVKTLVEGIGQLANLAKLYLNLFGWGEQKAEQISDRAVKELAQNIRELHNAQCIELDLGCWGEKNPSVTSKSLKYLSDMIDSLYFVKDLSLNLNYWANKNTKMLDTDIRQFFKSMMNWKHLQKLYLNIQDWEEISMVLKHELSQAVKVNLNNPNIKILIDNQ